MLHHDSHDSAGEESPAESYEESYERARALVLTQLSFAARTRAHLEDVLTRRHFPEDVRAAVLNRMTDVGLINDEEYASAWVRGRQRSKGLSRRALRTELAHKGIDAQLIDTALEQVADDDERAAARSLVDKKLASLGALEPAARTRRLVGLLARKGYSSALAFSVVKEALAEICEADQSDLSAAQW